MGAKTQEKCVLVSTIEKKGFDIVFQDGQVLIKLRGSNPDAATVLGVRESNLYRLEGVDLIPFFRSDDYCLMIFYFIIE